MRERGDWHEKNGSEMGMRSAYRSAGKIAGGGEPEEENLPAVEVLLWNLIPVECGLVPVPRIKVVDRRVAVGAQGQAGEAQGEGVEARGEDVPVVDIRRSSRAAEEGSAARKSVNDRQSENVTVLVLP